MKKLLLSVFGFAAMMASANAQIFTETFDTEIPAAWTIIDVDNLTSTNGQAIYASWAWNAGTQEASSSSWYDGFVGPTDDWLITPGIVIPATGTFQLEFDSYSQEAANYPESYEILWSTTGNTVADFTNPTILDIVDDPNDAPSPHSVVLPAATAGQTVYLAFHHYSNDKSILSLDNVVVRELLADDAELTSLDIAEYVVAGNTTISGVITNQGANTITALDVVWDDGSGPQTDNLTGLSIASGATYTFNHAIQLSVAAGTSYSLDVNVALTGDLNAANDLMSATVVGVTSIPAKIVVGEENTGTWCQWCPRGAVGLANMESEADFIGIAVHDNDPMEVTAYNTASSSLFPDFTGYPNGAIDRVIGTDPNAADFLSNHNIRKNAIVPCAVNSITAEYNATTGMVSISTVAEFVGNVTGEYRLSAIIVQDDMASSAGGWGQVNAYAGGGSGTLAFPAGLNNGYSFSSGPGTVPAAAFGGYDHVARSLSTNDIYGDAGSLPMDPSIGTYNYSFADVNATTMPGAGDVPFEATLAHAIVMVIAPNGQILNAGKAPINFPTSIDNADVAKFNLNVFPNPTADNAEVSFNLETTDNVKMEVYNAMGALVYAKDAGKLAAGNHKMAFNGTDLNSGFYFVNLTIGNQVITKKVTLTK